MAFHRQLLQLVPEWEAVLSPRETADLLAIGRRVLANAEARYSRWLDDEERAA